MFTIKRNTGKYPYGKRIVAYVVDAFILNCLSRIGSYLTYELSTSFSVIATILLAGTSFLYFVYLHWKTGQTIGKKLLKIHLASASGDVQIPLSKIILRESIKFLPGLVIFLIIIYMLITGEDQLLPDLVTYSFISVVYLLISIGVAGLNAKTQTIHDLIVRTVVIDSRHTS